MGLSLSGTNAMSDDAEDDTVTPASEAPVASTMLTLTRPSAGSMLTPKAPARKERVLDEIIGKAALTSVSCPSGPPWPDRVCSG